MELRELLQQLAAAGHTVIVSSHQLGEVLHLAHDITVLAEGTIRYSGSLYELAPRGQLEEEFFRLTSPGHPSQAPTNREGESRA